MYITHERINDSVRPKKKKCLFGVSWTTLENGPDPRLSKENMIYLPNLAYLRRKYELLEICKTEYFLVLWLQNKGKEKRKKRKEKRNKKREKEAKHLLTCLTYFCGHENPKHFFVLSKQCYPSEVKRYKIINILTFFSIIN